MNRLDPDGMLVGEARWLNDNIVDLKIRLMALGLEGCSDIQSDDIYVLTSHFYTKLVEGNPRVARYDLVHRWAKGVDLFKKKLIFVPINAPKSHWKLAVIVNPGLCSVNVFM